MLKIDPWNIIWTIVNLLFLYFVFKKFLFDRVMDVINKRDEMIKRSFLLHRKKKTTQREIKKSSIMKSLTVQKRS